MKGISMKKTITGIIFAATLIALAGCGKGKATEDVNNMQIANPFVTVETMAEVKDKLGFDVSYKEPQGYSEKAYKTFTNGFKMADIYYRMPSDDADGLNRIIIRKADTTSEDISGDYSAYTLSKTVDGKKIRGYEETGLYHAADWDADGFRYSILFDSGISEEEMLAFINEVK